MEFADLKPGDEITVRLDHSKATCRAQVRELRPGLVIGVSGTLLPSAGATMPSSSNPRALWHTTGQNEKAPR
jgi:hypothetical protein